MAKQITWAAGVMTVPARLETLLPATLASLAAAGFDKPRLFVDGCREECVIRCQALQLHNRQHPLAGYTCRFPAVGAFGSFYLSLVELLVRQPLADRYLMAQDDILLVRNLRGYLDRCPYPVNGYLSLCTYPENQRIAPASGWFESMIRGTLEGTPHPLRWQIGRGAQALVFDRSALMALLTSASFVLKPTRAVNPTRSIDGAVVDALNVAGFREWCHNPSLVQHVGMQTTISLPHDPPQQAISFPGVEFDALSLLEKR